MGSGLWPQGRCAMTFAEQREAALAVLSSDARLNRNSGGFLGQLCACDTTLSPKQLDWFSKLCEAAGVPFPGDPYDD